VAARCVSLAGVLAKLCPEQAVRLVSDENDVVVNAGRSRFRIRGLPLDQLPQSFTFDGAAVEVSLATEDMLHLIEATSYAAADEETRHYLNGVYLHITGTMLRAVATDGYRLSLCDLLLPVGAEDMPGVIVSNKTIAIITKLLKRKDAPETITLRVSSRLIEFALADFTLTSKLVDSTFPDYQRVIPHDYRQSATVDCDELDAAMARVLAALDPATKKLARIAGLSWDNGALHITRADMDVDDVLDAETNGTGKTALRIPYVAAILDAFSGKRVCISGNGIDTAIRFNDPDDPTAFAIVMPAKGVAA
jgi:DNA polymerase-3 subunit beta